MYMDRYIMFIRHGQAQHNIEGRLVSHTPGISLTTTGRSEVKQLTKALQDIPIDAIITSPLERATETATIINKKYQVKIHTEQRLIEVNCGNQWTNQLERDVAKDPDWYRYFHDNTFIPPGGESLSEVCIRSVQSVYYWMKQLPDAKILAFVSHKDVLNRTIGHLAGLPYAQVTLLPIPTASLSIVQYFDEAYPPVHIETLGWIPDPCPQLNVLSSVVT
jgi:probable phosphoglycerate mutase